MTTAHRPTWAPAKGGAEEGGARFFAPSERRMAKDLRSQTEMKFRCVAVTGAMRCMHAPR